MLSYKLPLLSVVLLTANFSFMLSTVCREIMQADHLICELVPLLLYLFGYPALDITSDSNQPNIARHHKVVLVVGGPGLPLRQLSLQVLLNLLVKKNLIGYTHGIWQDKSIYLMMTSESSLIID